MSWHLLDTTVNVVIDIGVGTIVVIGIIGMASMARDLIRSARQARARRLVREHAATLSHVRRVAPPYDWQNPAYRRSKAGTN